MMAKAILIMDMPESCDMCDLCYTLPFGNKICYIKLKGVPRQKRPDFCPLRELPEKKETVNPQECYTNSYWTDKMKAGFNACLDEIIG